MISPRLSLFSHFFFFHSLGQHCRQEASTAGAQQGRMAPRSPVRAPGSVHSQSLIWQEVCTLSLSSGRNCALIVSHPAGSVHAQSLIWQEEPI